MSFFLLSLILLKQPLTTYGQIAIVDIAVEAKVRTLPNAEILSEITSDFLLTRSAILRLLYKDNCPELGLRQFNRIRIPIHDKLL